MKVTKDITMMWGVRHKFEIRLRAGLRVRNTNSHGEKPPYTSFPVDSFYRHDAIHYGIRLSEEQVQDGL